METSKLIPAPIDDKNIMTDWIEEIFDFDCAASNGETYLGFVEGKPIRCDIIGYQLWWRFLNNSASDCAPAMHELIERLKEIDKENEGIATDYYEMSRSQLVQSFYFVDED